MFKIIKLLPILFLVLFTTAQSQSFDSLRTKKQIHISDSLKASAKDTLAVNDSLKKVIAARNIIKPIYEEPLDSYGNFINRETINGLDYRYTGDLFKPFSFNFTRDYGFIGYPNETMLYGMGFNSISYLEDGVPINNRLTNSLDLNFVQSEYIDSIEVVPSPRGFLYGSISNPSTVNFISRDFIAVKPYSRIKYYQGPSGEALIDGIFNERVFKKFDLSFDVTNRKADSTYTNSSFSIWQAKVRLKYFLSNKINLLGSYDFYNSKLGLNGGVNVDSIARTYTDINYYLYNEYLAPVNYPFRNQRVKDHLFNLKLLGKFVPNSLTDLNFYYKYNQTDLNQYQDTTSYKTIGKNKIYGVAFKQSYSAGIFNIQLNANYEKADIKYYSLSNSFLNYYPIKYNNYAISSILSFKLLDSTLIPSLYYKYDNESGNIYQPSVNGMYNGYGADISYYFLKNSKIYLGYSNYKTYAHSGIVKDFEAGISLSSGNIYTDLKYFKRNNLELPERYPFLSYERYYPALEGVGFNLNFLIWKIGIETTTSLYSTNNRSQLLYLLPKINFKGGLYYEDMLFHSNLNLKTGLVFHYNGKQEYSNNLNVNQSNDLDFTLTGIIQKVAIIYFTWQNLFDNQYYMIPYYPMPRRAIRFGIAWVLFD